ncbi:hypothetical protein [Paenibacillus sp. FSL W7-1287]|uniref:hypothetical protein n=1 Tax=Paenibacillus sp. FSL W7-1287 TaxID=2954538 RepID=UPI0030F5839B
MDGIINEILSNLKQICLDLRPDSKINKVAFNQVYQLLESHRIELKKLEVVPADFAMGILYTSFSLIHQCNYSKSKTELGNECRMFYQSILRTFDIEIEISELNDEWIKSKFKEEKKEVRINDFIRLIKTLYELKLKDENEELIPVINKAMTELMK